MPRTAYRMPPSEQAVAPARGRLARFDRVERAAHWLTALLFGVLVATGAILYIPSLANLVHRRLLIEDIHLYTGIAAFVPLLAAVVGPWGRRLRRDLSSMNRFTRDEFTWLATFGREGRRAIAKFNPGQKLNTFAVAGFLAVLWGTGLFLRYANFVAVTWRTGATFVHDWSAVAIALLVAGHVVEAFAHPSALRAMVVGWVPESWAERHAPQWLASTRTSAETLVRDRPPAARRGRAPNASSDPRSPRVPDGPRASAAPAGGSDPWAPVPSPPSQHGPG